MHPDSTRVAISGGGSGGHAIPALTIGKTIRDIQPGTEILFIGSRDSIEERLTTDEGFPFRGVWISQFSRSLSLSNLLLPVKCFVSLFQAIAYLIVYKIQIVVGTGGYASWAACAAARIIGRPYVIQEQNAYPGLVTRILSNGARRIYLGYEAAVEHLKVRLERVEITGNPVPANVEILSQVEAREKLGLSPQRPTVFVTGGSAGALSINKVVNSLKDGWTTLGYNLVWQVGRNFDGSMAVPEDASKYLIIERFFSPDRMALAYMAADVAVARCGAMTLSELALYGVPAVLVPYPYAADDHQAANGRAVESAGGGTVILNKDLTPETLSVAVQDVMHESRRKRMADAMRRLARENAANVIAEDILMMAR